MNIRINTIWNLAGSVIPLIAALLVIPYLLKMFGSEAFGVLTLIWGLIGYFSFFDFGVGRALTYEVGRRMPASPEQLAPFVRSGLIITALTGLIGAVLVGILATPLSKHWLNINFAMQDDTRLAFLIAAFGVIPTTILSGLRGALEGLNKFFVSNVNRSIIGTLMFLLPALSVYTNGTSLWHATLYMVIARLAILFIALIQLRKYITKSMALSSLHLKSLINYGMWVTLSGVISPLMVYGDRFFVSAAVGVKLLAIYAIPQEGLQRILIIPAALASALMPKMAVVHSKTQLKLSYSENIRKVAIYMAIICLLAAVFSYPIIKFWISEEFANSSKTVILILCVGIWFNSIAQIPYAFLQARGKPKSIAIIHLAELALYILALYLLSKFYGVKGAALAWSLRAFLDAILLHTSCSKSLFSRNYKL